MLEFLILMTAALCVFGVVSAYTSYRDVFHPAVIILPMFAFIYVIMPLYQMRSGTLFNFVGEDRLVWVQTIVVAGLLCLIWGLKAGSAAEPAPRAREIAGYRQETLHQGAYILGALGLAAWAYVVHNGGGVTRVFGQANGRGWSDNAYIRETVYLMIVALLLLLSPEGFRPQSKLWRTAVVCFSAPFLMQGLLGAQRGPTFLIVVTLAMSWYLARFKRPSLITVLGGGAFLGLLLLFLVANRSSIYLGSDKELKSDSSEILEANTANEYVFGAGCMIAADAEHRYFWGRRYLAQVVVRPIPHQIWPNKYVDFGVPELLQNAGVADEGLAAVMGWPSTPGAAGAMVADLWVEFSWLAIPVMGAIGYAYGAVWRRAVTLGGVWTTQYVIFVLLSIYMVTQSGEAVIFRFVILTLPTRYFWKKAEIQIAPA
jgi:hypothetical protein